MHSANLVVLLAGAAAAQSTVTLLNFYGPFSSPTLTFKGSDAKATTYAAECPAGGSASSSSASGTNPTPSASLSLTLFQQPRDRQQRVGTVAIVYEDND